MFDWQVADVLVPVQCYKCGVWFAIPRKQQEALKATQDTFCCPNGHEQSYVESTAERLKKELKVVRDERDRLKLSVTNLADGLDKEIATSNRLRKQLAKRRKVVGR